jgi:hypothetical protein
VRTVHIGVLDGSVNWVWFYLGNSGIGRDEASTTNSLSLLRIKFTYLIMLIGAVMGIGVEGYLDQGVCSVAPFYRRPKQQERE